MENRMRKPEWLRKKIRLSDLEGMQKLLGRAGLHTICEEAMCPNIGECFAHNVATFLILGERCTRACTFCAVSKGKPLPPDPQEPQRIADAVRELGLRHVVITSPTRDDLHDGGAEPFCETVRAIHAVERSVTVELLIPDMRENTVSLEKIAHSGAKIIAHNIETVPRRYDIRGGAEYERSLRVLRSLSSLNPAIATKSGIMLGLGEKDDEVFSVMRDLLCSGCRLLSIGQYLSPSSEYEAMVEYVKPERFAYLREEGLKMGFDFIHSSPYTRSSYMAHDYLQSGRGDILI